MRSVLAYPGNMMHAQQAALAFAERNMLEAYVTSFAWNAHGRLASLLESIPLSGGRQIARTLSRRSLPLLPSEIVRTYPFWELVRSALLVAGRHPVLTDLAWDQLSHRFDAMVARCYVPSVDVIVCFEYAALAAFKRAKQLGVATVLHLPSLDSRQFEEIQRREKSAWPELVGSHDAYFAAKFERRYARRCEEIALADVVMVNSSLTMRSHVQAGADPAKIFAVPLGAPPVVDEISDRTRSAASPLRVIWAGSFSLGKGAHYMLDGWKRLAPGTSARLDVYGQEALPTRLQATAGEGIIFHGSVTKSELFRAYSDADVLVFPTLSDGFGMVVAEALAHGLPVITTDRAGAADLVSPLSGFIIPAANPQALADSLQWCLDNRQRLAEMRFHALAAARARQWSHFRHDLMESLQVGLRRAGHTADFPPCTSA